MTRVKVATVVVVDDDIDKRAGRASRLTNAGFVVTAVDFDEALTLSWHGFDAAVVDMHDACAKVVDRFRGVRVVEAIRRESENMLVAVVTGYEQDRGLELRLYDLGWTYLRTHFQVGRDGKRDLLVELLRDPPMPDGPLVVPEPVEIALNTYLEPVGSAKREEFLQQVSNDPTLRDLLAQAPDERSPTAVVDRWRFRASVAGIEKLFGRPIARKRFLGALDVLFGTRARPGPEGQGRLRDR